MHVKDCCDRLVHQQQQRSSTSTSTSSSSHHRYRHPCCHCSHSHHLFQNHYRNLPFRCSGDSGVSCICSSILRFATGTKFAAIATVITIRASSTKRIFLQLIVITALICLFPTTSCSGAEASELSASAIASFKNVRIVASTIVKKMNGAHVVN